MLPTYLCPTCHEPTIGPWRKFQASDQRPAVCRKCRGLSYVSVWAHVGVAFGIEILLWTAIILALALKSWWALLFFPAGLVAMVAVVGRFFPLKVTDRERVAQARRSAVIEFVVAIAMILTIAWLFSHK